MLEKKEHNNGKKWKGAKEGSFKYELNLFKMGAVFVCHRLVIILSFVLTLFASFHMFSYIAIRLEIEFMDKQVCLIFSLVLAGITAKIFLPWLGRKIQKLFTHKSKR